MAIKGRLIPGGVAVATVACGIAMVGGISAGYTLGSKDKAKAEAAAYDKGYQAASVKAPQDGDGTRFEISDGNLDFLVARQIPEGEAVYSVHAKCTNISESLDVTKPGDGLYIFDDTDNGVREENGRWDNPLLPTQNDGIVDAVDMPAPSPHTFDDFWGEPVLGEHLIRPYDYEGNKPVFEEGERLMRMMRHRLGWMNVNLELLFI